MAAGAITRLAHALPSVEASVAEDEPATKFFKRDIKFIDRCEPSGIDDDAGLHGLTSRRAARRGSGNGWLNRGNLRLLL